MSAVVDSRVGSSAAAPTAASPLDAPRSRREPTWWRDAVGCATWASLLVVVALWVHGAGLQALTGWGPGLTSLGRLTGLLASNLLLMQVLLMARIPMVERTFGQDELARRHRLVGFWSFTLMVGHVLLIVLGYALEASTNPLAELWTVVVDDPGMLLAAAASLLLVLVVVTSIRAARRRLRYESWHLLHLYAYLGVGLALPHQLWTGQEFLSSRVATVYWWSLWIVAAGAVLGWRVLVPLYRTLTHRLRVVAVVPESDKVVSIVMQGRRLERLPAQAGQFFTWRFLDGPGATRGHPYSLSAPPDGDRLRITVKALGDGSGGLAQVRPGTRVAIEGPYGRLHEGVRTHRKVLLMGSGVGVTPLRGLLESMSQEPGDVTLIYRAHSSADLILKAEIDAVAAQRGARVRYAVGPRIPGRHSWLPESAAHLTDADALRHLVPDVADHDVYLCGAVAWMSAARAAATEAGVPSHAIHEERFSW